MTQHTGLPVSGYTTQPQSNIDLANEGKALEERYLRWLDKLHEAASTSIHLEDMNERRRFVALARTHIQTGAMFSIRSIFLPQRINLPEDAP